MSGGPADWFLEMRVGLETTRVRKYRSKVHHMSAMRAELEGLEGHRKYIASRVGKYWR